MASCGSCAASMPDGVRFCRECGAAMVAPGCPSCGSPDEGGRFCGTCGAALAGASAASPVAVDLPVAERRLTSVLFGDLVGFTPLSESRDAEEVRELLSAYFEKCRTVIGRYGGVVEKFIGDAVMAVWGVPVAHEDDAERAVRAGLDLVATVAAMGEEIGAPGLALRVGVVTGEVAVTVGATSQGMVAGDSVNTAARVQSAAEPGKVWVDETTRSLSAAAITFSDVGEHQLKGKAQPVRLWQAGVVVAAVGGGQRVDGLEAPMVGREPDLRLLKELFHATGEAGRPRLVVLDGEAGIGKSRLAWEFEKYVDGLRINTWWHRGRCLSYGDGVAFWALAEAIRTRFGLVESDTGDVVAEQLDRRLVEFVADPAEREWLRPRLGVLLGLGSGTAFAREDLFAAWAAFLAHLSDNGDTVVLVVEDAQYADDGMLDFVDQLLATARAPVFVLAPARPELLARRPQLGGRRTSVVRLEPLETEDMAELVDGLVHGLPADARDGLVSRSEGVPLFAVETIRALIDQDLVVPRGGRYVPADDAALDLDAVGAPASLHALVAARLDVLTAEERRVVADASVLGESFFREGLVALGSAPDALDPLLTSLARKEIFALETDRFSAELGQYRFVQTVVRQVAYSTQSRRDRKARHVAAADHLAGEPDPGDDLAVLVAQHLIDAVEASQAGDDDVAELTARARRSLQRAAARSQRLGATAEAQRLLELALARCSDPAELAALHLGAAQAAIAAGHYEQAVEHASRATSMFEALDQALLAGQAAGAHAEALVYLGDNTSVIALAEPQVRALEQIPGSERSLLALYRQLTRARQRRGELGAAGAAAERSLLLAEALGDPDAVCQAYLLVARRYGSMGAPITERLLYETTIEIAREHDLPTTLGTALLNLGSILNGRDLPAAIEYSREAVEVGRRHGQQETIDFSMFNRLTALWASGRHDEVAAELADTWETLVSTSIRLSLLTLEGWLAEARGMPRPEREVDGETDDESDLAWVAGDQITRLAADGDAAGAAAVADEAIQHLLAASGIDDDFFVLWPPMVVSALAAGDLPLARRLLQPVEEVQMGRVGQAVAAQWHRLRGLVAAAAGEDRELVEAELRTGLAGLKAFGAVTYQALAAEDLGRWLVEEGRTDEARPVLDEARSAYAAMGAAGWLVRLDAWESSRGLGRAVDQAENSSVSPASV